MKIKKLLLALVGAAASIAASAASPDRVVFIGDSITAQSVWGYGYCTAMKPLMPDSTLVSLGWSGQTLDGWKNAEIDNRGGSGDYGTELETGFRIGTELGSLDTAPVTWRGESAAQDGDLLIPAGDAGTAGFYRIVVGDRAPQN